MVGPMLGALLIELMPMSAIMLVDIGGAAFAILCLMFVHIPDVPQTAGRPQLLADMKQGLAVMRANRPLMAVFWPMMLMSILYMPLGSLFPLLIRVHFLGGAWHTGIAEVAFAGGLLVSSLVIGMWGGMKKRFLMASLAVAMLGLATMVSGALPPEGFWLFLICCFFMGSAGTFLNVPIMAYTQESTAPEMMGKVFSLLMTAMTLTMPIGLLVAGPACELIGVEVWFFWSGVALVGTGAFCRLTTRRYDAETMRPGAALPQSE